jgi:2-hydroxychromene-2-carboxylate isomerase
MTATVEFIFDIAAPNGYLAWYPLKDIAARIGARLEVTPVFLGGMHKLTGNAPPMMRDADVKGKVPYAALEFQRFLDRHGMDQFRMHPALPFNSILLQRVLVAASDEAERQALVEALLPAVWERNIDCGDAEVVGAELAAAGFDAERLLTATQEPGVKAKLAANTEAAVARGAFGIPTFFVDGEMWFGKERLEQIEAYLGGGRP